MGFVALRPKSITHFANSLQTELSLDLYIVFRIYVDTSPCFDISPSLSLDGKNGDFLDIQVHNVHVPFSNDLNIQLHAVIRAARRIGSI